jgi:galactoside O-acetyltransferase
MKYANINLGKDVEIDPSSSVNNVTIGDNVRIAKRCSVFGSPDNLLEIGSDTYIGMNSLLNGFADKLTIGCNVSIAQNVNIMVDSGPNASPAMQQVFPLEKKPVTVGNHVWIGTGSIIMPGVTLGDFCVVAANSYVNKSYDPFTIIVGNPAKILRIFTEDVKQKFLGE